jgi:transcriptional regulator GlxA family with amidase domain
VIQTYAKIKTSLAPGQQPREAITFAILIFPGFPMMAFSSIIEPLRAANTLAGQTCYSWITVGLTGERVRASNGLDIAPNYSVRTAPVVDRVVLNSGGDADHIIAEEALAWIRRNLRTGAQLGSVADAAFFLARAGLLDDHACTLHWISQPAFQEAFPDLDLRRDLYVIDRKRFTSAGGVGALDMMLDLIGRDSGAELSAGVAEWFVHSPLRSSVDRKLMPLRLRTGVHDELVLAAIAIMEDEVEDRLSIAGLAVRLRVSPDKLERSFRGELGVSPGTYYRTTRLRRAHDLLAHSTLPVREVALSCGFWSVSSFSRAFREQYGYTPREVRTP